jgi:LPXTG-motif cell wall-anchored protein
MKPLSLRVSDVVRHIIKGGFMMKKGTKFFGFIMLVLCLVVSMTGVAFASTDLTGMKNDVYSAQTTPDAQGINFKMNFTVEGGKVANFTFGKFAGANKFSSGFIAAVSDQKQKDAIQAAVDEQDYYTTQMASVGDATKVAKYSKAIDDSMYTAFQTLWKQLVTQGGGKIVEDGTATTSSSNPKTGDSGILVYMIVAVAALLGMTVLRKKKVTI